MTQEERNAWQTEINTMTKEPSAEDTTPTSVEVEMIRSAEWNTHRPCKKDDEALKGLIDNIRENGMIHRIAIRVMPDEQYEIIDGHRRFEAAKALGWECVPCEVYTDMSDEEAQATTLSANIMRVVNDPLLEAECIEKLADAGNTYEQIAAQLGTDERYVARRARIINLSDKWRDLLKDAEVAADELEMIASHERELQDEVYDELDIDPEDFELDPGLIGRRFNSLMRQIGADTPFDTTECLTCPYNTATHGFLFPSEEQCKGRCQRKACFDKKWNEAVDAEIEKLRKKKVEVKQATHKWSVPNSWNSTPKKTKTNNVPYVYMDGSLKYLVWSRKEERVSTGPAMTEEEKAAARKVKKAHAAWKKNRTSAYDKIRRILKEQAAIETVVDAMVSNFRFAELMKKKLTESYRSYVYDSNCQEIYEILTDAGLADANCEALTAEEIEALDTGDPADAVNENADNGEEA